MEGLIQDVSEFLSFQFNKGEIKITKFLSLVILMLSVISTCLVFQDNLLISMWLLILNYM